MLINKSNLDAMFNGYNTKFQQVFDGTPSHLDALAMTVPSTGRTENYAWFGTMPGLRQWIGPRHVKNLSAHNYSITNEPFESTIGVPRDDIEDDRYGVYAPFFSEMGRSAKVHPELLVFRLMKAAFETACYDGQPFFDTDHPVGEGNQVQSVANTDGGSGAAWFLIDTSRAVKPFVFQKRRDYQLVRKDQLSDDNVFFNKEFIYGVDARCNVGVSLWQLAWGSKQDLIAEKYKAAREAMMAFTDDDNQPLGVMPDTLVCGPSNEENALTLLNAANLASGATNVWKGTAKLIVTPYLD